MKLYAVSYKDARDRRHVVAVPAETPQAALDQIIFFQEQDKDTPHYWYNGFYCDERPSLDDVVEIDHEEGVQILFHEDYD